MEHLLIDSSIYRADPRRTKPGFRAVARLARAGAVQLHVPRYVKEEFLSQQRHAINSEIGAIEAAANAIRRSTEHADLRTYAQATKTKAAQIQRRTLEWITVEFQSWIAECKATEHPVQPDHGRRVTDDYFDGAPPFRTPKHREDIPDSFIWQTALDIVRDHGILNVVSADGALLEAAGKHGQMRAYRTIDDFIQTDSCQEALDDLTPEIVAENIERIKARLPDLQDQLLHGLGTDIVEALHGKTVRHPAIPDDNNEATVLMVGEPEETEFDFAKVEHYGDGELGIHFTAYVGCTLNYAIYKADYYTLPDIEDISIEERNKHYFDAEQDYSLTVKGVFSIMIDTEKLEGDQLTDDDLAALINDAEHSTEVFDTEVNVPGF